MSEFEMKIKKIDRIKREKLTEEYTIKKMTLSDDDKVYTANLTGPEHAFEGCKAGQLVKLSIINPQTTLEVKSKKK
jgi:hypothetical protein